MKKSWYEMTCRHRCLCLISLLSILLILPTADVFGMAQSSVQRVEWEEIRTQYFALIFPADSRAVAQMIYDNFGLAIDQEYEFLQKVFEIELILPINLRIYPTVADYRELNPKAPQISQTDTHSHVGFREISLIDENIAANYADWSATTLSAIRFELGVLFTEQVTDLKAPPGLLAGVGAYMLNPLANQSEFLASIPSQMDLKRPAVTWQNLWEDEASFNNPILRLQALSIVAYLVERDTWMGFVGFLNDLANPRDVAEVVSDHYHLDASTFQRNWVEYYPTFWTERWQYNALYNYDLAPYQNALKLGAYASLEQNLKELLPFLVKTGQAEGMETVAQLLESARKGQLAGSTALQARQALTSGEYEQAIQLANSALEQFAALGDFRREAEINAYRQRAEEVLMLRGQAAELMAQARLLSNPSEAVAALRGLQARLTALGDTQGSQGISQTVQEVEDVLTRRQNRSYLLIAGVALLLLVARIGLSFRSKPTEANL